MKTLAQMINKKLLKNILLGFGASGILLLFLFLAVMMIVVGFLYDGDRATQKGSANKLPATVEAYRGMMQEVCEQYDMQNYVDVMLAIMAVETKGNGNDPMNMSKNPYNTKYPKGIKDVKYSIQCGVQYFRNMQDAVVMERPSELPRLALAVQGYSFGEDYIYWSIDNEKLYSKENAREYQSVVEDIKGDFSFAGKVLYYYTPNGLTEDDLKELVVVDGGGGSNNGAGGGGTGTGQFIWPVPGFFSMSRGYGMDGDEFHRGLDIIGAGIFGVPIVAADGGTVIVAGWHYSYGFHVQVDHGNGYRTIYAHCSSLNVSVGQSVGAGDVLAFIGSTGNSSGPHLHFEVLFHSQLLDPASVL